jgi:hypothetical protein
LLIHREHLPDLEIVFLNTRNSHLPDLTGTMASSMKARTQTTTTARSLLHTSIKAGLHHLRSKISNVRLAPTSFLGHELLIVAANRSHIVIICLN